MAKALDPTDELLRSNLEKFIKESGLTANAVGDLAAVANLGRYVRGENAIPANILKQLADVLGRSVGDFYELAPPPPREPDALFLRARPDAEIPPEIMREVSEYLSEKNKAIRALKAKKAKR